MMRLLFLALASLSAGTVSLPVAAQTPVSVATRVEADGTRTLVHETIVDAPRAAVWNAISTAEGWRTWAAPVTWTVEGARDLLDTSYNPADRPGDPGTIRQQFLVRVPERLLAFRTVKAPAAFPHWASYRQVTSLFELEPAGAGRTRVRLTGVGYPADRDGQQAMRFFERGNATSLEWLRERFTRGPADWKKRAEAGKQDR